MSIDPGLPTSLSHPPPASYPFRMASTETLPATPSNPARPSVAAGPRTAPTFHAAIHRSDR